MARPLRIEYENAWYHVMNRGLAHNLIFLNDIHRLLFLDLLFEVSQRYQAEIHAYCLMDNHYHLLIHTPLGNISRVMRHIDGVYTQRFNKDVKRDGPIFRGRFKAILVEAEIYLLKLSRYIHLNPVKANLVYKPEYFRWSSYPAYLSEQPPLWLHTKYILSYFNDHSRKLEYKNFIEEEIDDDINDFYLKLKNTPILGTKEFTKLVSEKYLKDKHKINDIPEHKILTNTYKSNFHLKNILSTTASFYKIGVDDLFKSSNTRIKTIAAYLAATLGQHTLSEISQHLNLSISGISKACKRLREQMSINDEMKKEVESLWQFIINASNFKT